MCPCFTLAQEEGDLVGDLEVEGGLEGVAGGDLREETGDMEMEEDLGEAVAVYMLLGNSSIVANDS